MSDTAIIAFAGVITTIAGFYFQAWQIQRRFDQQQAEAKRIRGEQLEDMKFTARTLASKTESVAAELKKETLANRVEQREHGTAITTELEHNTKLTGMAYEAANAWKTKLEQLSKVFDSVNTDRQVQKHLTDLAEDTNKTVHDELQPDVTTIKDIVQRDVSNG